MKLPAAQSTAMLVNNPSRARRVRLPRSEFSEVTFDDGTPPIPAQASFSMKRADLDAGLGVDHIGKSSSMSFIRGRRLQRLLHRLRLRQESSGSTPGSNQIGFV